MFSDTLAGTKDRLRVANAAHDAWLPDAMWTLVRLESAVDGHQDLDVAMLCSHLREGARSAGVRPYVSVADGIQVGYESGNYRHSHELIETALACSLGVAQWLDRRAREKAPFVSCGRLIDVEA